MRKGEREREREREGGGGGGGGGGVTSVIPMGREIMVVKSNLKAAVRTVL